MKTLFLHIVILISFLTFLPFATSNTTKIITIAQNESTPEEEEEEVEEEEEEKEEEEEEEAEEEVEEEVVEAEEEKEEVEKEEAEEEIKEPGEEFEEGDEEGDEEDTEKADPSLVVDRVFTLLIDTIGRLTTKPLVKTIEGLKKIKAKVISDFKKGFIEIPRIGLLKFKKVVETVKKKVKPKLMGVLYDLTGKTIQTLRAGAFTLKILRMVITGSIPQLECEVIFFKNKGKLTQTATSEGVVTFVLEFEKPFMIPTGLNRSAPINRFDVKMSADERYAQTKTRLFGTKTEEPSTIRLDLSYIPFTFKVQSKNIKMATIEPLLKATPLANVVLKTLTLRIIPFPPSINITGIADMGKASIGMEGKVPDARVTAGLGAMGIYFLLNVKNWVLPYNLGILHDGQIKVGTPM